MTRTFVKISCASLITTMDNVLEQIILCLGDSILNKNKSTIAGRSDDMTTDRNMTKSHSAFDRFSELTSNLAMALACFFILLMMIHVTVDVLGKYIFTIPAPATIEAVQFFYMVALVFLPFAYVSRSEGHIFVELFTRSMAPHSQHFLDGIMGILTLTWLILVSIYAGQEGISSTIEGEFQETADGILYVWPSRWLVPLGSAIMALAVASRIIQDFKKSFKSHHNN
jgi:TRAP-type C4-dicarboxylate transport system permease small subunit